MKKIVFATHNSHKISEIRQILPDLDIVGLDEIKIHDEIVENGLTLEANAEIKADFVYQKTGLSCFADDTGLEVDALHGAPGVYSARYAGNGHDFKANMDKLLQEMQGVENRAARFRTVICLIFKGKKHFFEGIVEGQIIEEEKGEKGFGYDPVFLPNGHHLTFAEMTAEAKNVISHRGRAVEKLKSFFGGLF